ncbi:MAG: hypothetical protein J6T98_10480 [Salinivirgaceae bacterium]|nr:hypothetical protein [Salinivirgaceae bacterium]
MRRLFWAAMGVALISMVFAGCKKETTYLVQVTATEGGTVEGQNGEYKEGETVVFTAIPADGYYFTNWSDGNTDNPRTIIISNKEVTITAEFVQSPLVTITAGDNGTIDTEVNARYTPGSSVTVTAKPDDGCGFVRWSDGNTDNPRTITIGNEDISLTALFAVMFFAPTVDLGLESGTLWATCNLGAEKPWEYGDYYAWGETETKDCYNWKTYKYCKGSYNTITKYCNNAEFGNDGFTDALKTLLPEDDAATILLGSDYSMPTNAEWKELGWQCYWVWTYNYNNQNINGYIVYKAKAEGDKGTKVFSDGTPSASYSLKDAHIFLPGAGFLDHMALNYADSRGYYLSASLGEDSPDRTHFCYFNSRDVVCPSDYYRYCGYSVRPVKRP